MLQSEENMTKIPYITGFNAYLKTRKISDRAHTEYLNSLHDFFDYMIEHNADFKVSEDVKEIHEEDIRSFKNFLDSNLQLSPSTINKVLSNLNVYFKYLFSIKKNLEIPTMNVNSLTVKAQENFPTEVFENLPKYLSDEDLNVYTLLLILIISKGYSYQEALSEGFYSEFQNLSFSTDERKFISIYHTFIKPYADFWNNGNLFLSRNKGAKSPLLSVSALHRNLKNDSEILKLDLTPKKLYTTFVLITLSAQEPSDFQLKFINNMSTSSLLYYRRVLRESDFKM